MIYTREHVNALDGQYVVLLFNRSGVQNNAFEQVKLRYSFKFQVISIDINPPPSNVQNNVIHITGDWRTELDKLVAQRGKPAVIVANSLCTFNTYLCPSNHRQDGEITNITYTGNGTKPKWMSELDRLNDKKKWMKVAFDLLKMKVPVVILENPMGFMDQVITYNDSSAAYVEVHPWMFADPKNINPEDMRNKRTHLFSGGSMDAILEHPIQDYILSQEKLDGVEKNWVAAQTDDPNGESASDKRSKISPGMALGIAKCAIDRFLHSKQHQFEWAEFTYNEAEIHPAPKNLCNNTLSNGKGFCNLSLDHGNKTRNHKRGMGLACGIFCYEKNKYLYKDPEPTERICKVAANQAIHDTMFKSSHKQDPATEHREVNKRKVYTCSICGEPKKGHVCKSLQKQDQAKDKVNKPMRKVYTCKICGKPKKGHVCNFKPICKYIKTTTIRKVYTCRLCGMPKKGHICKFSL